jgi:hypothetical protein
VKGAQNLTDRMSARIPWFCGWGTKKGRNNFVKASQIFTALYQKKMWGVHKI